MILDSSLVFALSVVIVMLSVLGFMFALISESYIIPLGFLLLGYTGCSGFMTVTSAEYTYSNKIVANDVTGIMIDRSNVKDSKFILENNIVDVRSYVMDKTGYKMNSIITGETNENRVELWIRETNYERRWIKPDYTVDLIIYNTGGLQWKTN